MMETTLGRSKEGMKLKIPEIRKALDIVEALEKKHGKSTRNSLIG
jgi:hypothetical protein